MKLIITKVLVILLLLLIGVSAASPFPLKASASTGPDLTVDKISLSPTEPALDDVLTITVAVKNTGDVLAYGSYVSCYIDNSILDTRHIDPLEPGMTATVIFNWKTQGGPHTVKAIADFSGTVAETDENNNTGTYSFTTLAADLLIQSITWSPSNPSRGDNIAFNITVKNQGSYKSRFTNVNFLIDGNTRGLKDVPAINPGESLTITYNWIALSGEHVLRAVIDEMDSTREDNETNNELILAFSTLPPDLIIQNITWTPVSPSRGDTVTFTVTITNQGTGRAEASHLGYYIDGNFITTVDIPALDACASCNVIFRWTAAVDAHDILAIADYLKLVKESNETNNELQVSMVTAAPDLIITDLTWSPEEPAAGDTMFFTARLKNQGGGRAAASRAIFFIDGKVAGYFDFPVIEAGEERTAALSWTAESGLHAASVTADSGEKITESREDNNRYGTDFTVSPPDLTVTGISFSPENPAIGEKVDFTVTVKNQGKGKAPFFKVAFYIDDGIISVETVPSLEPGTSASTTASWEARKGRHIFKAYADYDNALMEENESNNSKTATVAPNMPDLSITNVTWSPPDITPGQETVFSIDIENLGGMEASASRIAYYVDDNIAGFNDIETIAAGDKATVSFTWIVAEGNHTINIVADSKGQITETDEKNNAIVLNIPPPDLAVQDINFTPPGVSAGDTVAITASIVNRGPNRTQNSLAACYIDGVSIGSKDLPPIDAGAIYESSFNWTAEAGVHDVKICVDITNTVIETDETNNYIEAVFSSMTPDLAIGDISWLTDSQLDSNEVSFTITVINTGAAPSGDFFLKYSFDDGPETTRKVSSIPAGGTAEVSFISFLSKGEHNASIMLDTEGEISEMDETNNERTFSFSTTAPDLVVRSVTWSPLTAGIGDSITITARVENRGGEKAEDVSVSLAIDGAEAGFIDIAEIGPGAMKDVEFTWAALEGEHEILIFADAGESVTECNETNNSKARTLTFTKQEPPVKKAAVIDVNSPDGGGLLESWWWAFMAIGVALGLVVLYTTIKNMRK